MDKHNIFDSPTKLRLQNIPKERFNLFMYILYMLTTKNSFTFTTVVTLSIMLSLFIDKQYIAAVVFAFIATLLEVICHHVIDLYINGPESSER